VRDEVEIRLPKSGAARASASTRSAGDFLGGQLEARVRPMFVRRFVQWLMGFRTSTRHVSLGASAAMGPVSEVAALPQATSWLTASRRLRPMRGVAMTTVSGLRDRQVPPRLRSGAIGREQVAAGRSRPLDAPPNAQPPLRGDPSVQQQPAQAAPQTEPLAPRQDVPSFEPAATFADAAALHRQLAAFKQLVRLGVYNEGFRRDALPEQYARGLHSDEDISLGDDSELSN
jgi:hypothetical protein